MTVYIHYLTSVYSFYGIFSSVICLQQKACGLEVSLAVTVAPGPGTAPTAERGRASSCRDGKSAMWADTRGHVTRVGASRAPDRILRALWASPHPLSANPLGTRCQCPPLTNGEVEAQGGKGRCRAGRMCSSCSQVARPPATPLEFGGQRSVPSVEIPVHGGLLVPKRPWLRGNRPDGQHQAPAHHCLGVKLVFRFLLLQDPERRKRGLARPEGTQREKELRTKSMTLVILPGACLDPNLKWSAPNDRPMKLPVLSNRPREGEVLPAGPGTLLTAPPAPQALADPLL